MCSYGDPGAAADLAKKRGERGTAVEPVPPEKGVGRDRGPAQGEGLPPPSTRSFVVNYEFFLYPLVYTAGYRLLYFSAKTIIIYYVKSNKKHRVFNGPGGIEFAKFLSS